MIAHARHRHTTRRLLLWIAALAVLMAALAPAVAQALVSGNGAAWVEVCTAQGARWISVDDAGDPSTTKAMHGLEHCPYCSLQLPTADLPPTPPAALPAPVRVAAFPPAFAAAPRTLHAWVSAQPRAPPTCA